MDQQGKDELVATTATGTSSESTQNQSTPELNIWLRGLLMLLFLVALRITEFIAFAIIVGQFFSKLITKKTNQRLTDFGESLSQFAAAVLRYQSFNSDERPFPFSPWPKVERSTATPGNDGVPPTQPQAS